jgi:hypothetical protein
MILTGGTISLEADLCSDYLQLATYPSMLEALPPLLAEVA